MSPTPGEAAAREGLGLPAGGTLSGVLARTPLLPSDWGGQDVVAAWARGGPEDATAVARAVAAGTAERVWGPHGRLWLTTPDLAGHLRVAYRHLEGQLGADEALTQRLRALWPEGASLTVGRAAGLLGSSRRVTGPALQLGCLRGWWRPGPRDDEGRIAFQPRAVADVGPAHEEACATVVARVVAAWGPCTVDGLTARLGADPTVDDGVPAAVVAGWLAWDGDRLVPTTDPGEPPGGGVAMLGRGDPFARVAATTPTTELVRAVAEPPPLVVVDGRLVGVWSERWVRRSLHLDVTLSGALDEAHQRALGQRIASLGRLRAARRTRWRRLVGDPTGSPADQARSGQEPSTQ